jgi:septal ring factor EnvC (AmiA/AmiB activator)
MAQFKAAIAALVGNAIVRSIVLALVGALVTVTLWLGQSELGNVHRAITEQSEAIKAQSGALGKVEEKINAFAEKLARVEERYAGHANRIDELAEQVSEIRRRLDQMVVEREMRLREWKESMAAHKSDRQQEGALRRMLEKLLRRQNDGRSAK